MEIQPTTGVVKISQKQSSGIRSLNLSQRAVGMVLAGEKAIYHNDSYTTIMRGELFMLCEGNHFVEDKVVDGKFEQIVFYISAEQLQQNLVALLNNYGIECTDNHHCHNCRRDNFVVCTPEPMIADLFNAVNISFSRSDFRDNNIVGSIKIAELIYLIINSNHACLKSKLLEGADAENVTFKRFVYQSILKDENIETLARRTHRSLTSFKKEFRRHFDTSPHKWIIEQRLLLARMLLLTGSKTISEIGNICSFTNTSHFIKLFKQRFQTTPAGLRKEHKATQG